MIEQQLVSGKAKLIRKLCLTSTTSAGSGHPTSALSAADLMTVLMDRYFTYDLESPRNISNDRLIFSKGHASPLFYALYAVAEAIPLAELDTLRKFGSRLEGHPTPAFPFTDAATGSLGQGLSVGAGIAYGIKNAGLQLESTPKVYVLLGDGELAEGQIWEAANFASHYKLHNLVAIADINRLAQSQETMFGHHVEEYEARFKAFGFETIVIDGHNLEEIDQAYTKVQQVGDKPYAIIAKTLKGKGISFLEDADNWHGKALKKEELEKALTELGEVDVELRFELKKPLQIESEKIDKVENPLSIEYKIGDEIATREIYGKILAELAKNHLDIYSLDGDVKNSTFSIDFMHAHQDRFIECFIAEQNMVSVAVGLSRIGMKPFVSTFAAFFSRSFDQIRMAALSHANVRFVGSHAGVSIGEDGASQMGLEDIAMFGSLPNSVVLHPSDAVSAAKLLEKMCMKDGISYLRTLRSKTEVIYPISDEFEIGGSKILRQSDNDLLTVVAAGITVPEALKAQKHLEEKGVFIRVVDCYSVKPIDQATLLSCLKATEKNVLVTVEDHFEHGGLGNFVLDAVATHDARVYKLAVKHLSRSGTKDELLRDAQIDAQAIEEQVEKILKYS